MSMKHMKMIVVVFEVVNALLVPNSNMLMYMHVDASKIGVARHFLNVNERIILCPDSTWYAMMHKVETEYPGASVTLMANLVESMGEWRSMVECNDMFLCATVSMETIEHTFGITELASSRGMVQELVVGSDPCKNMVRMVDRITLPHAGRTRLLFATPIEYTNSFLGSLTNTVRPMNMHGMCFDCRMAHTVAKTMLVWVDVVRSDDIEHVNETWRKSFAETVTTDVYEYLTSD